eukprot:TRINITY_DN3530_c0_g1_i2.p1 TRINITY_DN3530_c0_g1~~TRINITY_DN3530_c0_g1_i2.p1  ORF type:complete len:432 (+),score=93.17 TRINITY_DN3530_c0_g1_i2:83-1378(+)
MAAAARHVDPTRGDAADDDGQGVFRIEVVGTTHNTISLQWSPAGEHTVAATDKDGNVHSERTATAAATLGPLYSSASYKVFVDGTHFADIMTDRSPFAVGAASCGLVMPCHNLYDLSWVHDAEDDYLWTHPSVLRCHQLMDKLFQEAVYVLPGDRTVMCPNPVKRYCIDLRKAGVNWKKSRRMRATDLAGYRMTMDHDFRASFKAAGGAHVERTGGSWITDSLLDLLMTLRANTSALVKHRSFELWRGDELVAVSAGYAYGAAWHDATHATLDRSKGSHAGTILTKAMGYLLQQSGYDFWYWGLKSTGTAYMSEYVKYGGGEYPRENFVPAWKSATTRPSPPCPSVMLAMDKGLVRHKRPATPASTDAAVAVASAVATLAAAPPQASPPQASPPQASPPQASPPQASPPQASPPQVSVQTTPRASSRGEVL